GARLREAHADERGRVPAQGAYVRALLADHAARIAAPEASAGLLARGLLAPAAPLRKRPAAPRPPRHVTRARPRGLDLRRGARGPARTPRQRRARGRHRPLLRARLVGD